MLTALCGIVKWIIIDSSCTVNQDTQVEIERFLIRTRQQNVLNNVVVQVVGIT